MGIDVNVVCSMLITVLLSAGLLGYSVIKTNKEIPCKPFDILVFGERNVENKIYTADDQIIFRAATGINDKVTWDFGDNSPKMEGVGLRHSFAEEKIFEVTATLNDKCRSRIKIHIKQRENTVSDSIGNIVDPIDGESEAFVDEPVAFTTPIDATSYRWSIDRSGYPVKNSKDAIFTFKTSGTYSVRLMVNDDRTREYKFTITVKPIKRLVDADDKPIEIPSIETKEAPVEAPSQPASPAPPNPEPPKPVSTKVYTSDQNLKDYLQSYLCGKISLQALEPLFCDLNNTPVTVTEEKKLTSSTLANLCAALKCRRDIEIVSISEVHRSDDKCVTSFLIYIQKTKQKRACPDN